MKNVIPESPTQEVITEQLEKRRSEWISYFHNLSPRLEVTTRSDFSSEGKYDLFVDKVKHHLEEILRERLSEEIEIVGLPDKESIALVTTINSSLNHKKQVKLEDVYVFCYGNIAFGLTYIEEEDFEEYRDSSIYRFSLQSYPEDALSWEYISSRIKEKIQEIEESIPPLKE